jgi:hypothetical protein
MSLKLNLVDYRTYHGGDLPPMTAGLYEYVLAGNGLFLRAEREAIRALIPLAWADVRGLPPLEPRVQLLVPRVPTGLTRALYLSAVAECLPEPREVIYHLVREDGEAGGEWTLVKPAQVQTAVSVEPVGPFGGTSFETYLVEVHSHHAMAFHDFSATDDKSEAGLFRFFGLLVDIFQRPRLRLRLSVFGYRYEVPAALMFELPPEVADFGEEVTDGRETTC